MTIVDMLVQSGILTLLGLGVVFSFIVIMIGAMHVLHAVLHSLHLDEDPPQPEMPGAAKTAATAAKAQDNGAVVAAIAAALNK